MFFSGWKVLMALISPMVPIEIKSSMTFGKNLIRNLESYCEADRQAVKPRLIYDGEAMTDFGMHKINCTNWRDEYAID